METLISQEKFISFSSKVKMFINELHLNDDSLEEKLTKEVVRYFLKVGSRRKQTFALKSMFSKLGLRSEIDRFQNDYIHISYYLLRVLYPAVINTIRGNSIANKDVARDVSFCLKHLTIIEIDSIKKSTEDYDNTSYPVFDVCVGKESWVKNYNLLQKYVRSKVNKFYFILKNDPSMDIEDCTQEILLSVVRIYNLDPKAFANKHYVDMAINNHINTLLSYHTRGKRKRITGSSDTTYKEIKSLKNKMMVSKDKDKETYSTAITDLQNSIDKNTEYQATVIDFADAKYGWEVLTAEESIEDKVFVSEILSKVSSKKIIKEYFQILLDHNPEFEKWAEEHTLDTNKFPSLCRYAKKYLKRKYGQPFTTNWTEYITSNLNVRACLS